MVILQVANLMNIFQESAKLRADSLRTRITMLDVFCAIAETQLKVRALAHARISIERIRRSRSEIGRHLQEPHYVPPAAAAELWRLFEEVERKIEQLEMSLKFEKTPWRNNPAAERWRTS